MNVSTKLENAAAAVEDLASDFRGLLASKDFDAVPHIKAVRERLDVKLQAAREVLGEKSKMAAKKARDAADTANTYAHDEPWQIAGAALAVGLLVGLLLSGRKN